jgi:type IV secretory pathway TrbF-like protein
MPNSSKVENIVSIPTDQMRQLHEQSGSGRGVVKKAPPLTPSRKYLRKQAQREWDTRLGTEKRDKSWWRRGCFGLGLIVVLTEINSYRLAKLVEAKPRAIPHIIEIDKIGVAHYRGPVGESAKAANVPDRAIRYHLQKFVTLLRSVSSDGAVIQANLLEAFDWSTRVGQNLINKQLQQKNPIERALEERVSVEVHELLALSRDTWRVQWTETRHDPNGVTIDTTTWGGAFRLVFGLPDDRAKDEEYEKLLEKNPASIFIDYFDIQQLQAK